MNAALPFFLLGLPLVLAAYDFGRVRPVGTFGGFPWENLTSTWSRQPYPSEGHSKVEGRDDTPGQ
jgi:hypothetical protein